MQVTGDRGQRHVHDRDVQQEHERRHAYDQQGPPLALHSPILVMACASGCPGRWNEEGGGGPRQRPRCAATSRRPRSARPLRPAVDRNRRAAGRRRIVDRRWAITPAISSGLTHLEKSALGIEARFPGVSITLGRIALQRIPSSRYSTATASVKASTAALDEMYPAAPLKGRRTARVPTQTIEARHARPCPASRRARGPRTPASSDRCPEVEPELPLELLNRCLVHPAPGGEAADQVDQAAQRRICVRGARVDHLLDGVRVEQIGLDQFEAVAAPRRARVPSRRSTGPRPASRRRGAARRPRPPARPYLR